ncbi:hypothetical protein ACFW04_007635 [Cataglyphis niger]
MANNSNFSVKIDKRSRTIISFLILCHPLPPLNHHYHLLRCRRYHHHHYHHYHHHHQPP